MVYMVSCCFLFTGQSNSVICYKIIPFFLVSICLFLLRFLCNTDETGGYLLYITHINTSCYCTHVYKVVHHAMSCCYCYMTIPMYKILIIFLADTNVIAIFDSPHVGTATVSFNLVTVAKENYSNQTAKGSFTW